MPVTPIPFTSVTLVDGVWNFAWAYVGTVRVVLWGVLLAEQTGNTFTYPASSLYASNTTAPPIEVVASAAGGDLLWSDGEPLLWVDGAGLSLVETGGETTSERNKPYLVLQWYRVPCHHYRVEFLNGSTWTFSSTVSDNSDIYIQTFTTPLLPDVTMAQWRVIAVDDNKRESDPVVFTNLVVRPPDVPANPALGCSSSVLTVG